MNRCNPAATEAAKATDLIAIGAISGLQGANLRVPEDTSVVGVDDIVFARLSPPPLTTIHEPGESWGRWV